MDILGLDTVPVQPPGVTRGLILAARSVSTSFKEVMSPEMLNTILRSGKAPFSLQPHMMTLLDETPIPVVLKAVSEASTPEIPVKKIMKHLHQWALEWKVCRKVW